MVTDTDSSPADRFIARWSDAAAGERANAQLFLTELTDLLGVPRPGNDHALGYSFEFRVAVAGPLHQSVVVRMPRHPARRLTAGYAAACGAEVRRVFLRLDASGAG